MRCFLLWLWCFWYGLLIAKFRVPQVNTNFRSQTDEKVRWQPTAIQISRDIWDSNRRWVISFESSFLPNNGNGMGIGYDEVMLRFCWLDLDSRRWRCICHRGSAWQYFKWKLQPKPFQCSYICLLSVNCRYFHVRIRNNNCLGYFLPVLHILQLEDSTHFCPT